MKKMKWFLGTIIFFSSIAANAASVWSWIDGNWYRVQSDPTFEATFFSAWPHIVGDNNGRPIYGSGEIFRLDKRDGHVIWKYMGTGSAPYGPGITDTYFSDFMGIWKAIDSNQRTVKIVSQNGKLYQLHNHGRIWAYTNGQWVRIDDTSRTVDIVIASGVLYQLHNNGDIWKYNHNICLDLRLGKDCWTRIDNNRGVTRAIKEDNGYLLQLHY